MRKVNIISPSGASLKDCANHPSHGKVTALTIAVSLVSASFDSLADVKLEYTTGSDQAITIPDDGKTATINNNFTSANGSITISGSSLSPSELTVKQENNTQEVLFNNNKHFLNFKEGASQLNSASLIIEDSVNVRRGNPKGTAIAVEQENLKFGTITNNGRITSGGRLISVEKGAKVDKIVNKGTLINTYPDEQPEYGAVIALGNTLNNNNRTSGHVSSIELDGNVEGNNILALFNESTVDSLTLTGTATTRGDAVYVHGGELDKIELTERSQLTSPNGIVTFSTGGVGDVTVSGTVTITDSTNGIFVDNDSSSFKSLTFTPTAKVTGAKNIVVNGYKTSSRIGSLVLDGELSSIGALVAQKDQTNSRIDSITIKSSAKLSTPTNIINNTEGSTIGTSGGASSGITIESGFTDNNSQYLVRNAGTIYGVSVGKASNVDTDPNYSSKIRNSGAIEGILALQNGANVSVTNSGTMNTLSGAENSTLALTNSGSVTDITGGKNGSLTVDNQSGTISSVTA
ncbi:hypothetical protein, partial [Escherichia coli]|uniref:hypothetical protein n=1 Tax=Escherichia coli TaxID=562 RepID=UPI0029E7D5F7